MTIYSDFGDDLGMGQYLYNTFLVGWTSINPSYELGFAEGTRVLTHPQIIALATRKRIALAVFFFLIWADRNKDLGDPGPCLPCLVMIPPNLALWVVNPHEKTKHFIGDPPRRPCVAAHWWLETWYCTSLSVPMQPGWKKIPLMLGLEPAGAVVIPFFVCGCQGWCWTNKPIQVPSYTFLSLGNHVKNDLLCSLLMGFLVLSFRFHWFQLRTWRT